jgi:hypothetical protein
MSEWDFTSGVWCTLPPCRAEPTSSGISCASALRFFLVWVTVEWKWRWNSPEDENEHECTPSKLWTFTEKNQRTQLGWKENLLENENEHECTLSTVLPALGLNSEMKMKMRMRMTVKKIDDTRTEVALTENDTDDRHRWPPKLNQATSDGTHCLS